LVWAVLAVAAPLLEATLVEALDKMPSVEYPTLAVVAVAVLKVMALMPQAQAVPVSSSLDADNKVRHER
jgi:hypothetical protein